MTLEISDRHLFSLTATPNMPKFGTVAYNLQIQTVDVEDDGMPAEAGRGIFEIFRRCCTRSLHDSHRLPALSSRLLIWYDVINKTYHSFPIASCQVYKDGITYEVTARDQNISFIFNAIIDVKLIKAYMGEINPEDI